MKIKHVIAAWLTTLIIGSPLIFPAIELYPVLAFGGSIGDLDWSFEEIVSGGALFGGIALLASLPATLALLVTVSIFRQRNMTGHKLLLNTLRAQLGYAALTFAYIFLTEGTDEMFVAAAAVYTPIGTLCLLAYGLASRRRAVEY